MLPTKPLDRIAALIKAKRRQTGLGVRAAAKAADVNPATMSRLERRITASLPDSTTLTKLATWLEVSLSYLLGTSEPADDSQVQPSLPEVVEVHLRADHKLSAEKAEALASMFKILYQNAVSEPPQ